MKLPFFLLLLILSVSGSASEWRSLKAYQNETGLHTLSDKDWLKSDRTKKNQKWQSANVYNLKNLQPEEYQTIIERRDFYEWYYKTISKKGHEVVWPKMAHYISKKLKLTRTFPFSIVTKKAIKDYAYLGSETVFNAAFKMLNNLYLSEDILTDELAEAWDLRILHHEQYKWLQTIYVNINNNTLKTIDKMAKGACLYTFMVPKEIEFEGHIGVEKDRYNYAITKLKPYCEKRYQ